MLFPKTSLCLLAVVAALCCTVSAYSTFARNDDDVKDFTNHKVIRIKPKSIEEVHILNKLEQDFEMDYWNPALEDLRSVLTIVDPQREYFLTSLNQSSISYDVLTNSYQTVVDREQAHLRSHQALARSSKAFDYENTYHTYEEIFGQLKQLGDSDSSRTKYISVGDSYENREIPAIQVGKEGPVIFLECGIHSREWISTAFCLWMSNQLLANPELKPYTQKYRFIIVPVLNVDGYAFTHTSNRLWRKTRSRQSGTTCIGADPNRNWDSAFCLKGASTNPCSETYCGKSAFSERESLQMSKLVEKYKGEVAAYFAIHSYSQLWMYPWGYTYKLPSNVNQLNKISDAALKAIKSVNNLSFTRGSIANTIYLASGSSADYVYDKFSVPVVFAIELRDKGDYGFNLPPNQIKPACLETWAGLKAAIDNL